MIKNLTLQLVCALVLLALAFALVNPMDLWMPDSAHMLVLAAAVVVAGAFGMFVLAERTGDEREESHKMLAGRAAFFAGGIVLLLGIVVQSLAHVLDAWLVYALVAMVFAKIAARMYSERNW